MTCRISLPDQLLRSCATRADELADDHARLRAAAGSASRVSVEGIQPPDVIGLFVLLPSEA